MYLHGARANSSNIALPNEQSAVIRARCQPHSPLLPHTHKLQQPAARIGEGRLAGKQRASEGNAHQKAHQNQRASEGSAHQNATRIRTQRASERNAHQNATRIRLLPDRPFVV
jgi:hypothetical protein